MIEKGGDGTALTHWEKRIFQNEAMTGTVNTAQPVYSRSGMTDTSDDWKA